MGWLYGLKCTWRADEDGHIGSVLDGWDDANGGKGSGHIENEDN